MVEVYDRTSVVIFLFGWLAIGATSAAVQIFWLVAVTVALAVRRQPVRRSHAPDLETI